MVRTHLDELVDFPNLIVINLLKKQNILNLLADKENATIEDMEDENGNWKYFYDYEFIPDTQQEVKAAICVDVDVVAVPSGSIKRMELYVSVLCSHSFMNLDRRVFRGVTGNRLNNLVRHVDDALRQNRDFGIGRLELKNVRSVTSGNSNYAKKLITYAIPDFNIKGD